MKKILNYRPLFYIFIAFACGIIFARPLFASDIFSIIFISLVLIGLITISIIYKKFIRLVSLLCSFLLGITVFFVSIKSFNIASYQNLEVVVVGRVSVCNTYDNSQLFILEDVTVNDKKINKNIRVSIYSEDVVTTGNIIGFVGELVKVEPFNLKKFDSYSYKYNIGYTCKQNSNSINFFDEGSLNLNEKINIWVKNTLNKNMSKDIASVCYASLLGDKSYIDSDIKDSFSISGMAHMLAVSGLHVGFVISILNFILKKLKTNKYLQFFISCFILLFYCYLCSFSVSALRATIMFIVFALSGLFNKQYDKLNSLGVAGLIILAIKPLLIFDAGFLLSFASVFCIFMFSPSFNKCFKKIKMPTKIASSLSVMLSVQIGLLPLLSNYFSKTSIFSLFANFICIPIFEIAFSMLFVLVPIVICFSFLGFLLKLPEIILSGIIFIAKTIANIKLGIINLFTISTLGLVLIYSIFYICSHFINLLKIKKLFISCCILLFGLIILMSNIKANKYLFCVTTLKSYNNNVYVIELDGTTVSFGDFDKYMINTVNSYFDTVKHCKGDVVINLNDNDLDYSNFKEPLLNKNIVTTQEDFNIKNINFKPVIINNDIKGMFVENNNNTIYFSYNNCDINLTLAICDSYANNIDLLIIDDDINNKVIPTNINNILYQGKYIKQQTQNDSIFSEGNFCILFKNNSINKVWRLD